MSALVIKTGMSIEQQIARTYAAPGTLVLSGEFTIDTLDAAVPKDCEAIISVGVCGGLSPKALIGQAFIYRACRSPGGLVYPAAVWWRQRLFAATKYYECDVWSSGEFNTANTITERAALFAQSGCDVIDDETFAVAGLAARRNIAWIGLRTVSDGAEDNLPAAVVDALNPNGTANIWAVAASVVKDPSELPALLNTAAEAKRSFDELDTACIQAGPNFQWSVK
jgi:adenosylhomocysteine nucleosidase